MFIQVILLYLLTTSSADVHDTLTYHYDYDVVVYDATSGGVTAAVAAAQNGHHTALLCASFPACFVEGGQRVGGMSSGGLGQTDLGPTWPYIGGLAREFISEIVPIMAIDPRAAVAAVMLPPKKMAFHVASPLKKAVIILRSTWNHMSLALCLKRC